MDFSRSPNKNWMSALSSKSGFLPSISVASKPPKYSTIAAMTIVHIKGRKEVVSPWISNQSS